MKDNNKFLLINVTCGQWNRDFTFSSSLWFWSLRIWTGLSVFNVGIWICYIWDDVKITNTYQNRCKEYDNVSQLITNRTSIVKFIATFCHIYLFVEYLCSDKLQPYEAFYNVLLFLVNTKTSIKILLSKYDHEIQRELLELKCSEYRSD